MRKTTEEIIDMVANHYDSNKRAFDFGRGFCKYKTADGRKCAVGMCFNEKGMSEFGNFEGSYETMVECENDEGFYPKITSDIDKYFKEEFRGQTNGFWADLQELHDEARHWCETGLTELGAQKVKALKEKHCNNK